MKSKHAHPAARLAGPAVILSTLIAAGTASAAVTIETIGEVFALSVSADASVIAGNTVGDFETFRWTAQGGVERLGRGTFAAIGSGAGSPDISHDGNVISATVLDDTGTLQTVGRWDSGSMWTLLVPPLPGGATIVDSSMGSAWGMSDDGTSVVGFYWRDQTSSPFGVQAAVFLDGAVIDLPQNGDNARANDANFDGSVVVGWDTIPFGTWQPVVWENGVRTLLASGDAFTQASAVNSAGTVIGGSTSVGEAWQAAIWVKEDGAWNQTVIGVLPGTSSVFGGSIVRDVSQDGSIAIGFNQFSFSGGSGFIWTEDLGLMDANDWLESIGAPLDNIDVQDLTAISADGTTIVGFGIDTNTGLFESFIVRGIGEPCSSSCPADVDGSGSVDLQDLLAILAEFGSTCS